MSSECATVLTHSRESDINADIDVQDERVRECAARSPSTGKPMRKVLSEAAN